MTITFRCENNHKIRANENQAGQKGVCPKCKCRVLVPSKEPKLPQPRQMTESGVMRILGDAPAAPPMPSMPSPELAKREFRKCPRCKKRLSPAVTLCQHCHLYVGNAGTDKASFQAAR